MKSEKKAPNNNFSSNLKCLPEKMKLSNFLTPLKNDFLTSIFNNIFVLIDQFPWKMDFILISKRKKCFRNIKVQHNVQIINPGENLIFNLTFVKVINNYVNEYLTM